MSVILQAPHPLIMTTSYFPNPALEDVLAVQGEFVRKLAMNGLRYTYLKGDLANTKRHRLSYTFDQLSVMKAEELKAFLRSYSAAQIKMYNWKNEIWIVNIVNNPFNSETQGRFAPGCLVRAEFISVQIVFDGFKVGSF